MKILYPLLSYTMIVLAAFVGRSIKDVDATFEVISYDASSQKHVVRHPRGEDAEDLSDSQFDGCYIVPKGGALVGI